jgi:release factor glutamine methyltransferase
MGVNIQTIRDIRLFLTKELELIYHDQEISVLANIIIKTVFPSTKLHQLYMPDQKVTINQSLRIIEICNELKTGKPIQYIIGETVFFDCLIKVNNATLIPRQETEELVDLIIKENRGFRDNIIDFGTGSGCIAIVLAINLPGSHVTGIDISDRALLIAQQNALLNKVVVSFLEYDILNFDSDKVDKAGIIVSNPPYVTNREKKFMKKNVLDFEPHIALFVPDYDPLVYYRAILSSAEKTLLPGGKIYFEINEAMGISMVQLFESFGYAEINIVKDINGKDRIIKGTKNG